MEKILRSEQLIKSRNSRKLMVGHITIITVIFTMGKSTTLLSTQTIMLLTGLWSILLVGTIALRSKALNSIITNENYQTYNLKKENSSKLLKFLDITFFLVLKSTDIIILKIFFKIEAKNTHLIPKKGAVIVTANHSSHMDSMILQATFPRRITYLLLSKNYETWGKWFFSSQHTIPIKEKGINFNALKEGLELLKHNGTLCIFPEGKMTSNGTLQEAKPGIAFLAHKSSAAIVPAYISGAFDVSPIGSFFPSFRKISITYGEPIHFNEENTNKSKSREKFTNKIMEEIKKLSGQTR